MDDNGNGIVDRLVAGSTVCKESIDRLIEAIPSRFTGVDTKSIVSVIEGMKRDTGMADDDAVSSILENITYIKDIKGVTFDRYMVALRFVSMVLNGATQVDAWKTIYPEKTKKGYTQERMIRWATAYANTKLVSTLKASMMVSFSIQYSHFRHAAIQTTYDLMMGKAATSKVPMYERDEKGKILRDRDGQMMHLYDDHGDIRFEEVYQVVSPKVQQESAKTILEITTPPEELMAEQESAITKDDVQSIRNFTKALDDVSRQQREAMIKGGSIDEVQKIGHIIEAHIVDSEEDDD